MALNSPYGPSKSILLYEEIDCRQVISSKEIRGRGGGNAYRVNREGSKGAVIHKEGELRFHREVHLWIEGLNGLPFSQNGSAPLQKCGILDAGEGEAFCEVGGHKSGVAGGIQPAKEARKLGVGEGESGFQLTDGLSVILRCPPPHLRATESTIEQR